MIFNASATHALRALAYLAANEHHDATLGRDLAEEIAVPAHYLSKVLATLARAGLLTASRGTRGGYRLARPAGEITLIEIVEPFEGKRVRPGCLLRPDQPCRDDGACSAHTAWSEVKKVYSRFLETTTLADIRGGGVRADRGRGRRRRVRQRAARTRAGSSAPRRGRV
jgi:Rrf2 family protein